MSGVEVVRANERAATDFEWLGSKHSFSFGRHYAPATTHHGLLVVNNDDVIAPDTGLVLLSRLQGNPARPVVLDFLNYAQLPAGRSAGWVLGPRPGERSWAARPRIVR